MDGIEARKLIEQMKGDFEELVKEAKTQSDEFTKTPRTVEEMAAYLTEHRKTQQQKVNAIFNKHYDRYNDNVKP